MKVWIASFLVLFGIAELYQWAKHFTLPLPVYILGGAFLAIASNYERRGNFPFQNSEQQSEAISPPPKPKDNLAPSQFSPPMPAPSTPERSTPSISFIIERPNSQPID
jgi:hypothetical protein